MADASGFIYVGRLKITEDTAGYEQGSAQADRYNWRDPIDTRRLGPPYTLFIRFVSVGSAVTMTKLVAKLQHAMHLPSEEGLGGLAKTAVPATAWKDAEEATTAITTTDMTSTAAAETSNVLTEQLGSLARVLVDATSAGWNTGIYVDIWLKGNTG